jgi:glycosyltransferase involved in cell wall biosynthesis
LRIALTQKKMRWGGQAHHVLELARGLRERGHEVFAIAQPGSEFARRARAAEFQVAEIPMISGIRAQIASTLRLARFLRKNRIDVLHCHDPRDHQLGCFAAPLGGVGALIRTKHNVLPLRNAVSRWLSRSLTDKLIGVSDATARVLVDSGIEPDHVVTIYNFIDTGDFEPGPPDPELRATLGLREGDPVIGSVGRLHRSKGIADLIHAIPALAGKFPGLRVLLVGGGYEQWQELARELGVESHCRFTGRVSGVAQYLRLMDVAVYPTHREAFGLAILEAMAAQRAVVATRVGGVPELVQDGVNGLLVEPGRPEALATAIGRLLDSDDLRIGLAIAAHKTATSAFSRERSVEQTEQVYRAALSG